MTNSNLKFGFGFSAVNDSVKASAVEVKPQMIVRSTDGAFVLILVLVDHTLGVRR